jgi:2-(1,2-epoxy-1,2-dihydrophenyl)acetyl-CoA isomerase
MHSQETQMTPLLVNDDGRIVRIVLNRPEAANAIDQELAAAFLAALEGLASRPQPAVILLTGAGARFCSGGDVAAVAGAEEPGAYLTTLASTMHTALSLLHASPHVVVAAVQGAAAGAGLALVANADFVVSAPDTVFLSAYATVGLSTDCGMSRLLPEIVGLRRATEITIGGRVLTAAEALEWGLLTRVADPGALESETESLVQLLAAGPALAQARIKRLLHSKHASFAEHLEAEVAGLAAQIELSETRARMAAFLSRSQRRTADA